MSIIARKYDSRNTNYNQLKGSGLLPVLEPICKLDPCKPSSLPIPVGPVPRNRSIFPLKPLIAVKPSLKNNKWVLNGITYPNFNSLWANIPLKSFTILRTNG